MRPRGTTCAGRRLVAFAVAGRELEGGLGPAGKGEVEACLDQTHGLDGAALEREGGFPAEHECGELDERGPRCG